MNTRHGIAWGLFDDPSGPKDEIGTLNLLTKEVVLQAKNEIQIGKSVSLNWSMEKQHQPGFNRKGLQHKFVDWRVKAKESGGPDLFSYDDEITVNTQAGKLGVLEEHKGPMLILKLGSQWDGLSQ